MPVMRIAPILIAAAAAALLADVRTAVADRLIFQRAEAVYSSGLDGDSPRLRTNLPGSESLWAISADGRRIAWTKQLPGGADAGLQSRPLAIFVGDTVGRREKKLVTTNGLRDRNSLRVTEVGATRQEGGGDATR